MTLEQFEMPVGTRVRVTMDNGSVVSAQTKSKVQKVGGHVCVKVSCVKGWYPIERVEKVK